MSGPLAYLNGTLLPRADAVLPVHDAGLVFGAAVTDFCRTFRHRLFRWGDHLERFREGCRACFIPLAVGADELTAAAESLVAHNARLVGPEQELALVAFATPGAVAFYAGSPGPPTLCLHTAVLPWERYRRFFTHGVSLAVVGAHPAAADDLAPPAVKHRSRLHWWRADHLARARTPPADLALLADGAGAVTETSVGNLLVARGGVVHSPPPGQVLEGVSLRVVEELCADLGIGFVRRRLALDDCTAADEVLLSGSAFCLAGVSRIDGRGVPWPGQVTQRLLAAWGERVGLDVAGQFLAGR
jgi:branched-chain amino acid aminotransferase